MITSTITNTNIPSSLEVGTWFLIGKRREKRFALVGINGHDRSLQAEVEVMMKLIIDAHVHFYSLYQTDQALNYLFTNLGNLDATACRIALLAERHDCSFFHDLKSGKVKTDRFTIGPAAGNQSLSVKSGGQEAVRIYPGRQVVSGEKLEILALLVDGLDMEGRPAQDIIKATLDAGGVPAIGWAPGKWLFGRGREVVGLIDSFNAQSLLIGDTTLRPYGYPEPRAMKAAREKGMGIIAGSDPLPFTGEEAFMGTYGVLVDLPEFLDSIDSIDLRDMLLNSDPGRLQRVGLRNDFFTAATRALKCRFHG